MSPQPVGITAAILAGHTTAAAIAEHLHRDPEEVTPVVDAMVAAGFLVRTGDQLALANPDPYAGWAAPAQPAPPAPPTPRYDADPVAIAERIAAEVATGQAEATEAHATAEAARIAGDLGAEASRRYSDDTVRAAGMTPAGYAAACLRYQRTLALLRHTGQIGDDMARELAGRDLRPAQMRTMIDALPTVERHPDGVALHSSTNRQAALARLRTAPMDEVRHVADTLGVDLPAGITRRAAVRRVEQATQPPAGLVRQDPHWRYQGSGVVPSTCDLRVYRRGDGRVIAVVTDTGGGTSITNAAERIVADLRAQYPGRVVEVIEHTPASALAGEHFEQVTLDETGRPRWTPITADRMAAKVGRQAFDNGTWAAPAVDTAPSDGWYLEARGGAHDGTRVALD